VHNCDLNRRFAATRFLHLFQRRDWIIVGNCELEDNRRLLKAFLCINSSKSIETLPPPPLAYATLESARRHLSCIRDAIILRLPLFALLRVVMRGRLSFDKIKHDLSESEIHERACCGWNIRASHDPRAVLIIVARDAEQNCRTCYGVTA